MGCELCDTLGGELLWQGGRCRVVVAGGAEGSAFPGFCRVIWQTHVAEMTDLVPDDRQHFMAVVQAVETVVRSLVSPDKINLASLGNVVPHLHWHVIPRWRDDSHFPAPIWAPATRPGALRPRPDAACLRAALANKLKGMP